MGFEVKRFGFKESLLANQLSVLGPQFPLLKKERLCLSKM